MKSIRGVVILQTIVFLITLFIPYIVSAGTCDKWIAKVVSVQGKVEAQKSGETPWNPVKFRDTYCAGDKIRVMEQSRAVVKLFNDATLHLDQNSTVTLVGPEEEQTMLIELLNGAAYFFSRFPRSLKVITPFINAGVEGTEFFINVDKDKASMSVFKGKVSGTNKEGSITLSSGESAVAEKGKAPKSYIMAKPRDQVQWALYYPPVVYEKPEQLKEKDPRFHLYRASSLLKVGRIEEAKAEIEKTLKLDPKSSMALALQSIIVVAQNEKAAALDLAVQSVQADPNSASAHIALSYAKQADFDLNGALNSMKEAVKAEPDNALAWARLSEIWLSFGELDKALNAANKAVELNPNIARTQTVLGFANLTQVKIKEAKEAFEKAIELDQGAPLPRLGLGLAKIREGCLKEGREEIEVAATLDTGNSLIRSYLGKSYYEEKRDKQAGEEYSIAEELDPQDPTPFFYDAIRKQSINRPVEALQDMEKAIELNDDRAVYRSKLLLDSDLAARSASLARIYSDLGFENLALTEGWKAVNIDPTDFSAHRLLADSYSILPRHEIARVSELLQAQLLQPLNINPLQPSLAESNLYILNGAGPADLSFNEFNPLFNRNRIGLQMSSVWGDNKTFGDEIVASAVYGKVSISAGQFHYETDGFRENNDIKEDIYNLFAQVELSPQTSFQAEYRHKEVDQGDLSLRFNPAFLTDIREKNENDFVRVGIHHSFSPNSDLLISGTCQNFDADMPDIYKVNGIGYGAEAQHLYRTGKLKLITGVGYFTTDNELEIIGFSKSKFDVYHTNLYLYSNINFPEKFTWILGASGDFVKDDYLDLEKDQFNPKLGLIWNPLPRTTIRAAVFRTLKRQLINDQTLEPTQVAGFNQFYDDPNATDTWRYGIGIDQKFNEALSTGAEFSKRDLKITGQKYDEQSGAVTTEEFDLDELLGRAYVNWAPHPWVSLKGEYQYEKFKRPDDYIHQDLLYRLETHRLLFGINFFHPTGLFAKLIPTYVYQHGDFYVFDPSTGANNLEPGSDHFWVFDASLGFRFPKRYGIFSIEAKNLFDEKFKFQDTDPANPSISPERLVFAKLTLSF